MSAVDYLRQPSERVPGLGPAGEIADLKARMLGQIEDVVTGVEPGDLIIGGKHRRRMSFSAPINYDLYYLKRFRNLLGEDRSDSLEAISEGGRYHFVIEVLDGILPLITPRKVKDLMGYKTLADVGEYLSGNGVYTINEARYEVPAPDQALQWPTATVTWDDAQGGFVARSAAVPDGFAGYLAFPIRQLGAMEWMSLVRETDGVTYSAQTEGWLDGAMPPVGGDEQRGETVVSFGYRKADEVNYPCTRFSGRDDDENNFWLRLNLLESDTRPVPGEFIGLICRPMEFHFWWYQESCPLLYAGNWFETEAYTSGIVEYVANEDERVFQVRVKGESLLIQASDYYGYAVGERVAVVKKWDAPGENAFNWGDLELKEEDTGIDTVNGWQIVPVSFYQN